MRAALAGFVALVSAAVFAPALSGGFLQWDDAATLIDNPAWRGFSFSHLRWMLTTLRMGPWQPLSWLSYALDRAIWGLNPFGFHLTNLLLQGAAAGLCVLLFDELIRLSSPETGEGERAWAAAFGALIFAIHPLRVESVAWITERRDVLSGLFSVLALNLYLRRAQGRGGLLPVYFSFIMACLSKGSAVTLPLIFLILDVWPLHRRAYLEKIPFLLISLAVGLIGVLGQERYGVLKTVSQSGLGERMALSVHGLWFGLSKTFYPAGLSPYYPVPAGFGLGSLSVWVAGAALVLLASVAWAVRRRFPAIPTVLACYAALSLPVLGAVRFGAQLTADHFFYLPGLAWGGLGAAAFLFVPRGRVRALSAFAVILALAMISARLSVSWRDDLALWTRGVSAYPGALVPDVNLAHALRAAGREDEAAGFELRAIKADPDNADMRNNYGSWLLSKGRVREALEQLPRAAALAPGSAPIRYNLGMALRAAGLRREGLAELNRAVELDPSYAEGLNNLGLALLEDGKAEESIKSFAAASKIRPEWALPPYNLGNALTSLKRDAAAVDAYRRATVLDPKMTKAWVNGGNALARQGKYAEAIRLYRRALELEPGNVAAQSNLNAVRRAIKR